MRHLKILGQEWAIRIDLEQGRYHVKHRRKRGKVEWKTITRGIKLPRSIGSMPTEELILTSLELQAKGRAQAWVIIPMLTEEDARYIPREVRNRLEIPGLTNDLLKRSWKLASIHRCGQTTMAICKQEGRARKISVIERPRLEGAELWPEISSIILTPTQITPSESLNPLGEPHATPSPG